LAAGLERELDQHVLGRVGDQPAALAGVPGATSIQGICDRLEDRGLASARVADDGEQLPVAEVDLNALPEAAQALDDDVRGAHRYASCWSSAVASAITGSCSASTASRKRSKSEATRSACAGPISRSPRYSRKSSRTFGSPSAGSVAGTRGS